MKKMILACLMFHVSANAQTLSYVDTDTYLEMPRNAQTMYVVGIVDGMFSAQSPLAGVFQPCANTWTPDNIRALVLDEMRRRQQIGELEGPAATVAIITLMERCAEITNDAD